MGEKIVNGFLLILSLLYTYFCKRVFFRDADSSKNRFYAAACWLLCHSCFCISFCDVSDGQRGC